MLDYVVFHRGLDVDLFCVDLEISILLCRWRTKEVTGFAGKRVNKGEQEIEGRYIYHERLLSSDSILFKFDMRLSSLDHPVAAIWEVRDDGQPEYSPVAVVVSVPSVVCDDKGDWNSGYILSGSASGRERGCTAFSSIQDLVSHEGLPLPDDGSDVL